MSTRSGKRIQSAFYESTINTDVVELDVSSEKKTRIRRLKENLDKVNVTLVKVKKRNNYVSYPTDDELLTDVGINGDSKPKNTRVLRKNTLKERNIDLPPIENDETKKTVTSTRRTRKLTKNASEDCQETCIHVKDPANMEKPKSKKNKKKKYDVQVTMESMPKKKSKNKKKGRQSSSMVIEEIEPKENLVEGITESNISVHSFYSAAGSLEIDSGDKLADRSEEMTEFDTDIVYGTPFKNHNNMLINSVEKSTKKKTFIDENAFNNISLSQSTDSIVFQNRNQIDEENKTKKLSLKDIKFEKDIGPYNTFTKELKKCKSGLKDNSFDKDVTTKSLQTTIGNKRDMNNSTLDSVNTRSKRKSIINNVTSDVHVDTNEIVNTTFEKDSDNNSTAALIDHEKKHRSTFDKEINQTMSSSMTNISDKTFDKNGQISNSAFDVINSKKRKSQNDTTIEMDTLPNSSHTRNSDSNNRKSFINNTTFEKDAEAKFELVNNEVATIIDTTFETDNITRDNATYELKNKQNLLEKLPINSEMNTTFDKYKKLDATFDKSTINTNIIIDKSDMSRVSITIDESKENVVNMTPVLIESSLDESQICYFPKDSPKCDKILPPLTPLKREGTFTKDGPDVIIMSQKKISTEKTPSKRLSLPSPGCTPFHMTRSNQKEKSILNLTRSIEKSSRSSLAEVLPRVTKVMFCSPVNNPLVVTQQKIKVIKSNLKGSNKSFVFDDCAATRAVPRKRSYTQTDDYEARAKRKRLADDLQHSVDRLSRPRTSSASAKLTEPATPSKKLGTPMKTKPQTKVSRTKLPNFAALHQRQFEKMESLNECQERKAKRAKQLFTPTAVSVLERSSPKDTVIEHQKPTKETKKLETPLKSLPTLKSLNPGYTRFGFKLNLDVNPFSIPYKSTEVRPKEYKPNRVLTRQETLPSLTGTTSLRREAAKQMVMREKSFTERRNNKRNENRTIIKGVRTNRRFELQMKLRNLEQF